MKVYCINTDPERFPVSEDHKAFFRSRFGRNAVRRHDFVEVNQTYNVYAIKFMSVFPFYYVSSRKRADDWKFVPGLCFDVIDHRMSKLWHFGVEPVSMDIHGDPLAVTIAIKEWIEDPRFHEHLVDRRGREMKIMREAIAAMDSEYE